MARTQIAFTIGIALLTAPLPISAEEVGKSLDALKAAFEVELASGLGRTQSAITMNEYNFISALNAQPTVFQLVFLNKYGEVRWYRDPAQITKPYDYFVQAVKQPTDAIETAFAKIQPVSKPVGHGKTRHIAIPVVFHGEVSGIVSFQSEDDALTSLVSFCGTYRQNRAEMRKVHPKAEQPLKNAVGD